MIETSSVTSKNCFWFYWIGSGYVNNWDAKRFVNSIKKIADGLEFNGDLNAVFLNLPLQNFFHVDFSYQVISYILHNVFQTIRFIDFFGCSYIDYNGRY